MLRLPGGMRDFIAEMARRNGRSMNAEIINALAHQMARFSPEAEIPAELTDIMNEALAERIRRSEVQKAIREATKNLDQIAKELDRAVDQSRSAVKAKLRSSE